MNLDNLLHTLGLDAKHRDSWRNHYVTDVAEPEIIELVEAGLMELVTSPSFLPAGDRVYRATERGRSVAIAENNRKNPPPSREKSRYCEWLSLSDVCPDLKFGDYLRRRMYEKSA